MSESDPQPSPTRRGRDDQGRLSPALIATLVAIPVMVIAGFITVAVLKSNADTEVPIDSYATIAQDADKCGDFLDSLPRSYDEFTDKKRDGDTVRWTDDENRQVVLRCGVARPTALAPTSALQVIHPVQWFITDTQEGVGQAYVAVDHRPYIAVWLPAGAGSGAITDISAAIDEQLPAAPLDFG